MQEATGYWPSYAEMLHFELWERDDIGKKKEAFVVFKINGEEISVYGRKGGIKLESFKRIIGRVAGKGAM